MPPAKKTAPKTQKSGADVDALGRRSLVIVESPTKARTIGRYLPRGFRVMASVGHVRDLPQNASEIPEKYRGEKWARTGVDVHDNFRPLYVVPPTSRKVIKELKDALKDADQLILATDEDREGESISWHLLQELKPKVPVRRMVFHEITEPAIRRALSEFRDVDENLVRAQEARRIVDRLTGYTVSPLLWTTVAPRLSAGRVQSAAVRLVVQRERERRAFRSATWWDVIADLEHARQAFEGRLVALGGRRLATGKDFDKTTGKLSAAAAKEALLLDEPAARALVERLTGRPFVVVDREEEPFTTKPAAPFTTSTLQQEASRKLGLGARDTMRTAQALYERGFITYMRTDSVNLSDEAITAARAAAAEFGREYVPLHPRRYATKSANAQEAHEAIRPSGTTFRKPDDTGLDGRELRLYDLIWKRTVASQMPDARQVRVTVTLDCDDARFRASGKRIEFPGFIRAYVEGSDDPDAALEDREVILPAMEKGDRPACRALRPDGHETQPPARYTEASLVKALEDFGIGRPSTYASIMDTIQARGYVRKDGKALVPTFTAFAVTALLEEHLAPLVDTEFTARMETELDEIARGEQDQLAYLREFYFGDAQHPGLEPMVQHGASAVKNETGGARRVELEGLGAAVRIGRYGPYLEFEEDGQKFRANLPDTVAPADLTDSMARDLLRQRVDGPPSLGTDPATGLPVYLMNGQYGPYVQLGEAGEEEKPKRASLAKGMTPESITLEQALGLLALPRALGTHPESGNVVKASVGRFGPFVVHVKGGPDGKDDFRSVPAGEDVLTISLGRAVDLLAQPKRGRGAASGGTVAPLRELGAHAPTGLPVLVFEGRYGPYVQLGPTPADRKAKPVRATLPKGVTPESVTLPQAVALLEERAGALPAAGARKGAAKGGRKTAAKAPAKRAARARKAA
ncbi:DNA topoisomerase 1 [Gemmatimonadetes bacterium T265]|nr:DNA topoisomerase 1 [Gemmatimonadetes bacterium T265]